MINHEAHMQRGVLNSAATAQIRPVAIMTYQAKLKLPCAVVGIRIVADKLAGIDFLPLSTRALAPSNALASEVCAQIMAYVNDPDFRFAVPLLLTGSAHQMKVWQAITEIPCGEARTYGAIAQQLGSSPRAVGRACGDNPIPLIIPCHRVVAKTGVGGFMHHANGAPLAIKDWLLQHEGWRR